MSQNRPHPGLAYEEPPPRSINPDRAPRWVEPLAAITLWFYLWALISGLAASRSASTALFLSFHDARSLGTLYMVMAGAVTVALYGLAKLHRGIPHDRLALLTAAIASLGALGFLRGAAAFSGPAHSPSGHFLYHGLLYVFVETCTVVTTLQFWTLCNTFYNWPQAQRWYPFITSGGIVGSMTGGWLARQWAPGEPIELLWVLVAMGPAIWGAIAILSRCRAGFSASVISRPSGAELNRSPCDATHQADRHIHGFHWVTSRWSLGRFSLSRNGGWNGSNGTTRRPSGSSLRWLLDWNSWREKAFGSGSRRGSLPHLTSRWARVSITLGRLVFLTVFTTTLTDFYFKYFADRQFGANASGLTHFFGNYYLAVGLVTLALHVFVTPLLLRRAEAFTGLALMPAALLLSVGANLLYPTLALALTLKLIDSSFSHSVCRSCRELLFTPLPVELVGSFKTLSEGVAGRLGLLACGAVLLLTAPYLAGPFVLVAIGISTVVWLIAVWRLRLAYHHELPEIWTSGNGRHAPVTARSLDHAPVGR